MIICPKCDNNFSELDGTCHRCLGKRFITTKIKKGPKGAQTEYDKQSICPRCNGAGTEHANFNRNNRKRGATGEYKAIDTFTPWWLKPDGAQYEWRKTPQSGGSALAAGFDMAGDICTTAPDWPFHVESKRTAGWDFGQLMDQAHEDKHVYGDMYKYVAQVFTDVPRDERNRWKRVPLLFLQHPGPSQPAYAMLIQWQASINSLEGHPGVLQGVFRLAEMKAQEGTEFFRFIIMNIKNFVRYTPDDWRGWAKLMLR